MNASRLNLILSIVIVALLCVVGALYSKLPKESDAAPVEVALVDSSERGLAGAQKDTDASKAAESTVPKAGNSHTWETVESEDYLEYIANLRAIGCPEETIHDIIRADVNKLFDSRKEAKREPFEYWRTGNFMAQLMDQEKVNAHNEMNGQKRELLKTLLGEDAKLDDNLMAQMYNPVEQMLDFLDSEKQSRLMGKLQGWQAEAMKHISGGRPDAAELEELKKVRDKIEAELNVMLTPEEKRAYDLRLSNTSQQMRMSLGDFNPSKEEFEALFDLRLAFDNEHSVLGIPPADEAGREARKMAEEQFKKDAEALLGEERFKDFERAPRDEYKLAAKIAERQGLDRAVAEPVFDMMGPAQDTARDIRQDNRLNAEQKQAALNEICGTTREEIVKLLGEDGAAAYESQRGGRWLKGLQPKSD